MQSPEMRRADLGSPPETGPNTSKTSTDQSTGHLHLTASNSALTSTGAVIAIGRELAQDARRRHPLYVVESCPFACGGVHAHRGLGIRDSGCGRRYVLVVAA